MNFASGAFLVFLPAILLLHWLVPGHRPRKLLLLAASYYFYACWDWRFLGLIVLSTAIDYVAGLVMARSESDGTRKAAVTASIVSNLGILGVFKYAGFFAESFAELASTVGLHLTAVELDWVLPVGISFYTFQSMSYTIDLYRRRIEPCNDPFDFALFVAFFPQLVAGPIVRASDFLPQLQSAREWSTQCFGLGLERMIRGFAKKVILADTFAVVVDAVFSDPTAYGVVGTWAGAVAFVLQVYCDFAAYSDIAIGVAMMLGYRLPENFNYPYLSNSFNDFWQRWHISLSTWLRDYLYISLGGSRLGTRRTYVNLILTMILGGLWHGAAWHFVVWGMLHGVAQSIERILGIRRGGEPRLTNSLRVLRMLFFLIVTHVFFRASSLTDVGTMYEGMLGLRGFTTGEAANWAAMWLGIPVVATHLLAYFEEKNGAPIYSNQTWLRILITVGALLGTVAFWRPEADAFIYFQF